MSARKTSTKPTRVWKFAAKLTRESLSPAREILWRKHQYYNALVRIERARIERFAAIRAEQAPELAQLEREWERLDDALGALYCEAKRERAAHWRETAGDKRRLLPEQYEARKLALETGKRALSESAKPLRKAFGHLLDPARKEFKSRVQTRAGGAGPRTKARVNADVLAAMLEEEAWHGAWKRIVRSDAAAHSERLAARANCRLHGGTYLDVEAAFEKACRDSSPRPPRFQRLRFEGKIQIQPRHRTVWASLDGGRVRIEPLVSRRGTSPRSNIRRVTLDQSQGEERSVIGAICRLHRLPPEDAEVKWIALVVRKQGCQLQLTLEHPDLADLSKRPAGTQAPLHVRLGWARGADGLRVARLCGPDGVDREQVHCPERIVRQKAYAESVESIAETLRLRALRRLRAVLAVAGHRVDRRAFESQRQREWLRARCQDYAAYRLGGRDAVRDRWRAWRRDRKSRGVDLYASVRELRAAMPAEQAFAWWCWLWAAKDRHLEELAAASVRRFIHRRDAHYRAEAIRIATRFESVTVDAYSIARLKELEPLTMPRTGVRDLSQEQLHAAAPGRFREILLDVMGPRCVPCERPGAAQTPASARHRKTVQHPKDAGAPPATP